MGRGVKADVGETHVLRIRGDGEMPSVGDLALFGVATLESVPVVVTNIEAGEEFSAIYRMIDAAPIIDELIDAEVVPEWSSVVGAEAGADLAAPPVPSFTRIVDAFAGGFVSRRIEYLLSPATGSVQTQTFEVRHRIVGDAQWTTVSQPVANGGGAIEPFTKGDQVALQVRAVSAQGVPSAYSDEIIFAVGANDAGLPNALEDAAISAIGRLGGVSISFAVADDPDIAQVQFYHSRSAVLDTSTDAAGDPAPVQANATFAKTFGDLTRSNLFDTSQLTFGAGWAGQDGVYTHSSGAAGSVSQSLDLDDGSYYRVGGTIAGVTAGDLQPRLVGGAAVNGPSFASGGPFATALLANAGSNRLRLTADADFDGTISDLAIYLATAACLDQGTHYFWIEPLNVDGLPGPMSGPIELEIIYAWPYQGREADRAARPACS